MKTSIKNTLSEDNDLHLLRKNINRDIKDIISISDNKEMATEKIISLLNIIQNNFKVVASQYDRDKDETALLKKVNLHSVIAEIRNDINKKVYDLINAVSGDSYSLSMLASHLRLLASDLGKTSKLLSEHVSNNKEK